MNQTKNIQNSEISYSHSFFPFLNPKAISIMHLSSKTLDYSQNKTNSKTKFNAKFPHINIDYYTQLTKDLLHKLYPKYCIHCKTEMTKDISTRETTAKSKSTNSDTARFITL